MAVRDVGYLRVPASQFTTGKQIYAVPAEVYAGVVSSRESCDPFYAARPGVAGAKRPLDTTEFPETAVPLIRTRDDHVEEPQRERRIIIMKKRG